MNYAPIVIFVYNRLDHTRKTIEALSKNDGASESELFIFADGAKKEGDPKVAEVREYIRTITGFKEIHIYESEVNRGLANSVIHGVTKIVNEFGRVIVMEDDLETVPHFLSYMNEALIKYENEKKVFSIAGYSYFPQGCPDLNETYFLQNMSSWTWATWADRWAYFDPDAKGWEELLTNKKLVYDFDHDGCFSLGRMMRAQMVEKSIDSWLVRWCWSAYKEGGLGLFPNKTLAVNIGFDGTGTNCGFDSDMAYQETSDHKITYFPSDVVETEETRKAVDALYRAKHRAHCRERLGYYLTHINKIPQKLAKMLRRQ